MTTIEELMKNQELLANQSVLQEDRIIEKMTALAIAKLHTGAAGGWQALYESVRAEVAAQLKTVAQ